MATLALIQCINEELDFQWEYFQELNDLLNPPGIPKGLTFQEVPCTDIYIVVLKNGMKRRYGMYTLARLGCIRKERGLFRRLAGISHRKIYVTEDISWKVLAKYMPAIRINWLGEVVEHL
jgi:hypothetical protein